MTDKWKDVPEASTPLWRDRFENTSHYWVAGSCPVCNSTDSLRLYFYVHRRDDLTVAPFAVNEGSLTVTPEAMRSAEQERAADRERRHVDLGNEK
jgi:hypothetical protein